MLKQPKRWNALASLADTGLGPLFYNHFTTFNYTLVAQPANFQPAFRFFAKMLLLERSLVLSRVTAQEKAIMGLVLEALSEAADMLEELAEGVEGPGSQSAGHLLQRAAAGGTSSRATWKVQTN